MWNRSFIVRLECDNKSVVVPNNADSARVCSLVAATIHSRHFPSSPTFRLIPTSECQVRNRPLFLATTGPAVKLRLSPFFPIMSWSWFSVGALSSPIIRISSVTFEFEINFAEKNQIALKG